MQDLSIYIHIPFCVRKCAYCDFLSSPQDEETREKYVCALVRSIRAGAPFCAPERQNQAQAGSGGAQDRLVRTIYLGGGTPSLLAPGQILRILEAVFDTFRVDPDAEITLECNPGTASPENLLAYRRCGVNRLSVGVQSMNDQELAMLGRIHTAQDAVRTVRAARGAGFENVSLDLMSALPGQNFDSFRASLHGIMQLEPEHLSVYSLILEEGTPLAERALKGTLPEIPGDEEDRRMYYYTREYLERFGLEQYEISNYALPGRQSSHNVGYWTGREYLGFGLGAASWFAGRRFHVTRSLQQFIEDPCHEKNLEEISVLSLREQMEEFMFLGLRMTQGVSGKDFLQRFGQKMEEVYRDPIRRFTDAGLLVREEDRIRLTFRGLDLANTVMAEFLL